MFDYLAKQDVQDSASDIATPPLIVFFLEPCAPPPRLDSPVLTGGEVMSGCWLLEHWDSYENLGMYYSHPDGPDELTNEQAADYLTYGP